MKTKDIYDLLKELKSLGARIYTVDGKIKLDIKPGILTSEIADSINYFRDDLLVLLGSSSKRIKYIEIEKVAQQESYPISDAQRRLWVLSQFEGGSIAYNMPSNVLLNQHVDIDCFKRAVESTIARHEILRTVLKADENGEIRQWILKREDLDFRIDYQDFRKDKNKEEKIRAYITADSNKAFNLIDGPLLRAGLLQVEDQSYVFYYNMHHIISDSWSMEVLSRDVLSYYEAYKENKQPSLKELRIQYKDYATWQLGQFKEESFNANRDYWLESLDGELPLLDLPSNKQRPRIKTHNGHGLCTYVNSETTNKLKNYSKENGGSVFMGLLATWNILVYRYTGQKDIITGTPIAGREHADLEDQIGFYINTLALRNEIKPEESFNAFYNTLKDKTLKSYSHQRYPFDRLLEELHLHRDTSRSTVFDVSITYHNTSEMKEIGILDDQVINLISSTGLSQVKFDIELHFQEVGNYLSFHVIYNDDVYDRELMEDLMAHYKQLLNFLLLHPERQISMAECLSEKEREELLFTFNATKVNYPSTKTIVELFSEQASKTPNSIALVFEEKSLSYKELDEQSTQLAHFLRNTYNISKEDLVGIQLERSEWVIIAILGILKAGGAYVPIDPEYPVSRKQHIIEDTSLKLLITETNFILNIDYYEGAVFAIDVEFEASTYCSDSLALTTTSKDLAYVMYTSGSTGRPKGVMIEQRSVVRLVKHTNIYSFSGSDKLLCTGAMSFDATTFEYWGPLLNGGQLILCSQRVLLDSNLLNREIKNRSINIMWFTAGWLNQLVESNIEIFSSLSTIVAGGDKLSPTHIKKLKKQYPHLTMINGYGPTENTTFSITHNIEEITCDIPLGTPITNTQVYILSEEKALQPKGIKGEIYLGGEGLARGYLNQETLTKEKFIINPFNTGELLYKTGDLGRWTKEGTIAFLGRKDDQVKLRGYRIELGEIEHALESHKEIKAAVVVVKENQHKEKELIAYITSEVEQHTIALRSYLKALLAEYMLPTYYVQLETFPLNSNGKIDKKALPSPEGLGLLSGAVYVAPGNELEERLVKIWEEVLQRTNIGMKDDFFALGGHSIKIIQISKMYKVMLDKNVPLNFFISNPTIREHSQYMDAHLNASMAGQEELIKLNAFSDTNKNMIMIPPIQGESIYFMGFSKFIEDNYNCYGINYGLEHNFKSLIELSAYYAELINTWFLNQRTPLYILGFSMGASIAFEIVKRLEALNYNCELLLIDRMPNSELLVKEMQKMDFGNNKIWLNQQVLLASKISPHKDVGVIRKQIMANLNILNHHLTTGKVNSNILCIKGSAESELFDINLWKPYTNGQFKVEKIKAVHDEIFNKNNYEKLYDLIKKKS